MVESDSKNNGKNFEKEIIDLLKKLEFFDVDGARNDFNIGGVRVSAVAGWENILLVFECVSRKTLGKKDLSEKIYGIQGKMDSIRIGVQKDPIYNKYTKVWFVLATKNIEIKKEDIDLASSNKNKKVYLWFDDYLQYYANLYNFIKPYAKYDLLGELGIKPAVTTPITIPAFRTNIHGTIVYTFLMSPRDLLEVSFVARRERGSEQFYQRLINEDRVSKISSYIKSGGIFPNNIILAFREDLPVTFQEQPLNEVSEKDLQFGLLSFPRDYRSCWIIDGQHRLFAFSNITTSSNFRMPITAFEKLSLPNQRKYFLDINRNQKAVDPDLLWDLSGDFFDSIDGIISNSVKYLNTHSKSPLKSLIYYPSARKLSKKGKLKIAAMCNALKKNKIASEITLQNTHNPLFSKDHEEHYANIAWNLIRYLNEVKKIFPHNWNLSNKGFVLGSGGMTIMIGLFERILSRVSELGRTPNNNDYEKYLRPLKSILETKRQKELNNLRLRATSEAGKSELTNEFILIIRKDSKDPRFGGDIKNKDNNQEFTELENLLKELIKKYYSSLDNNKWLVDLVDEGTYRKALKNTEKNTGTADPQKAYLGLTLGECFTLIGNHFENVKNIFVNEEEYSFSNKNDLLAAGTWIGHTRATLTAHVTGAKIKKTDLEVYRSFMNKIMTCLQSEFSINSDYYSDELSEETDEI